MCQPHQGGKWLFWLNSGEVLTGNAHVLAKTGEPRTCQWSQEIPVERLSVVPLSMVLCTTVDSVILRVVGTHDTTEQDYYITGEKKKYITTVRKNLTTGFT